MNRLKMLLWIWWVKLLALTGAPDFIFFYSLHLFSLLDLHPVVPVCHGHLALNHSGTEGNLDTMSFQKSPALGSCTVHKYGSVSGSFCQLDPHIAGSLFQQLADRPPSESMFFRATYFSEIIGPRP